MKYYLLLPFLFSFICNGAEHDITVSDFLKNPHILVFPHTDHIIIGGKEGCLHFDKKTNESYLIHEYRIHSLNAHKQKNLVAIASIKGLLLYNVDTKEKTFLQNKACYDKSVSIEFGPHNKLILLKQGTHTTINHSKNTTLIQERKFLYIIDYCEKSIKKYTLSYPIPPYVTFNESLNQKEFSDERDYHLMILEKLAHIENKRIITKDQMVENYYVNQGDSFFYVKHSSINSQLLACLNENKSHCFIVKKNRIEPCNIPGIVVSKHIGSIAFHPNGHLALLILEEEKDKDEIELDKLPFISYIDYYNPYEKRLVARSCISKNNFYPENDLINGIDFSPDGKFIGVIVNNGYINLPVPIEVQKYTVINKNKVNK